MATPPPHTVGMSWWLPPPSVRISSVLGRPRMRPPWERVATPRCFRFARAHPPQIPDVLPELATHRTWEEGLIRAARTVSEYQSFRHTSIRLLPASFSPSVGARPSPLRSGACDLWLGLSWCWGGSLRTLRWAPPDRTALRDARVGPLGLLGWPLRILGASGRRGRPSGRRLGRWGPRMVFLPRRRARSPQTEVRPSFSPGPFRPFWVSGDRLRSPLTPRRRLPHAEHPGTGRRLLPWGLTVGTSLGVRPTGSPTPFLLNAPYLLQATVFSWLVV